LCGHWGLLNEGEAPVPPLPYSEVSEPGLVEVLDLFEKARNLAQASSPGHSWYAAVAD
jgi:hypothetical protein